MKVFNQINDVRDCAGSVVTIGTFDGLHRGHQDIIKTLTTIAAAKGNRTAVITFEVTCSKGTYVRVLGADIAAKLGTVGHLTALTRTRVGTYHIADATTIEELSNN